MMLSRSPQSPVISLAYKKTLLQEIPSVLAALGQEPGDEDRIYTYYITVPPWWLGEGMCAQGHPGDSGAEPGVDPGATPGSLGPPLRSALAPVNVTCVPAQASGRRGPQGPPDAFPCPLGPALSPALLPDRLPWLQPGLRTPLPPTT